MPSDSANKQYRQSTSHPCFLSFLITFFKLNNDRHTSNFQETNTIKDWPDKNVPNVPNVPNVRINTFVFICKISKLSTCKEV